MIANTIFGFDVNIAPHVLLHLKQNSIFNYQRYTILVIMVSLLVFLTIVVFLDDGLMSLTATKS